MIRCLAYAFIAIFKSKARLAAENLCLRQQLIVFKRRQDRSHLRDVDRRFWVLACCWFSGWRQSLIIVKPDTVIRWHRKGWKAYWWWRSSRWARTGQKKIDPELREHIRRLAQENQLWGQRRIQAELARLGFRFVHVRSPGICDVHTTERPPPVGNNSCINTPTIFGRVIC